MSTTIELLQVLGFAIPLLQARIKVGVSALNKPIVNAVLAAQLLRPCIFCAR